MNKLICTSASTTQVEPDPKMTPDVSIPLSWLESPCTTAPLPPTPLFPYSNTNICTSSWQRCYGLCSHCHICSAGNPAQAFHLGTEQFQTFSQHFPVQTSGMNKQLHLTCRAQASSQTNKQDISPGTLIYSTAQHKSIQQKSPWLRCALVEHCQLQLPTDQLQTDPEATAVAVPGSKAKHRQPARLTEALPSTKTK